MNAMEQELFNRLRSKEWRLDNLYAIRNKQGVLTRFVRNWAQRDLSQRDHPRQTILKARQLGMSTFIAISMLDACLFAGSNPINCSIIDKKQDDGVKKLDKIRLAYANLDKPLDDSPQAQAIAQIGALLKAEVKLEPAGTTLKFSNGCAISAGVSDRGDTLQFLHVSEFGYTAIHYPQRAQEVMSGTLPTVPKECKVYFESTHEGGRVGRNYEMLQAAMQAQSRKLSSIEFEFCFYPWFEHPDYIIEGGEPHMTPAEREYFDRLQQRHGIKLSQERKAWYCAMAKTLGLGLMKQEYPSTPDEAFDTAIEGSIYGDELAIAESEGRLYQSIHPDVSTPIYVAVDIGMSDDFTMWLMQPRDDGRFYVLDYFSSNGQTLNYYANHVKQWEREFKQLVECCFLPHDANKRGLNTGLTTAAEWGRLGLPYKVLPRIPDLWQGIRWTKAILSRCIFSERVAEPMKAASGKDRPSGLNCLLNYRRNVIATTGEDAPNPLHDSSSHGADSFRYFAEAFHRGYVGRDSAPSYHPNNTISPMAGY